MRYAIKYVYNDGNSYRENVNSAFERNDKIVLVENECNSIVACVYCPIYKSGEYGKRVVVTFRPLEIHHDGELYDLYVSGQVKE